MANFISGSELSSAIGANPYAGITDNADATVLAQLLNLADARVLSALRRSGYASITVATLSSYSTADQYMVKSMAIRVALAIGSARRGVSIPAFLEAWALPKDFDTAQIRLPDTAPDYASGAPGSILVADSGTQSDADNERDTSTTRGTTLGINNTGGYP